MTEYAIHAAQLATTILPGITGQAVERQREAHYPESAGGQWNRLRAIKRHNAAVQITSTGVKALLDFMPQGVGAAALPLPCMKLDGTNSLSLWAVQGQDDVPLPTTGNTHERLLINKGVLAARRLSWREPGEPAVLTCTAWPLSADGTTDFFSPTAAALPAVAAAESDFTLDSLTIEGSAYEEISDLEVEFECPWTPRFRAPNHRYPTYLSSAPTRGVCRVSGSFRTLDQALFRTWGSGFLGSAHRSLVITLRDYAQAAERGSATATMTLRCVLEIDGAEYGRPGGATVRFTSLGDNAGANALSWTTA